jgi:2-oxoglutarate ferredoxin oxidoreductase subunit gamma
METSIIIAGFGGQGVLFAGQVLAYAAMDAGRHVTWIPSYGPEMRGGTANCTVIISDQPIGAPIVDRPDIAVVLNAPSFEKYEPLVKKGGLLVVNSAIITLRSQRDDIDVAYVPANHIAAELGSTKMLNMVVVGAVLGARPILNLDQVGRSLNEHLPASKQSLLEANIQGLQRGFAAARDAVVV